MTRAKRHITAVRERELMAYAQQRVSPELSREALTALCKAHEGFCHQQAFRWAKRLRGHEEEDLVQLARIGLMKAALKFDMSRTTRLLTIAGYHVKNSMNTAEATNTCVKGPQRTALAVGSLDLACDGVSHAAAVIDRRSHPIEEVENTDALERLRAVMRTLPTRDAYVLTQRMNDVTLNAIGQELKLTRERVRQIESRAFNEVARAMRCEPRSLRRKRGNKRNGLRVATIRLVRPEPVIVVKPAAPQVNGHVGRPRELVGRESLVADALAQGASVKEVARELGVHRNTVHRLLNEDKCVSATARLRNARALVRSLEEQLLRLHDSLEEARKELSEIEETLRSRAESA